MVPWPQNRRWKVAITVVAVVSLVLLGREIYDTYMLQRLVARIEKNGELYHLYRLKAGPVRAFLYDRFGRSFPDPAWTFGIELNDIAISSADTRRLLHFSNLEILGGENLTFEQGAIANLASLPGLHFFALGDTSLTADDLQSIGKLSNLSAVYLYNCKIPGDRLWPFEQTPRLQFLSLLGTPIDDVGAECLRDAVSLRELILSETRITDRSLGMIGSLPNLEILDLCDTSVSLEGLKRISPMPSLRHLSLDGLTLTSEPRHLLSRFPKLETLSLCHTHLTDEDLRILLGEAPETLKEIVLLDTRVTGNGHALSQQNGSKVALVLDESDLESSLHTKAQRVYAIEK